MAEPLSIASGIAGIITLSSAVVATGYKYLDSVSSAPEELKDLICEIASINSLLSQLISHSVSQNLGLQDAFDALAQQNVLRDCEETLYKVQSLLHDCELTTGKRHRKALNVLFWPLKQKEIIKNRDRLSRLCTSLHTAISIDNASALKRIEKKREGDAEVTRYIAQDSHDIQVQKVLAWLSSVNPIGKHTATAILQQPGTYDWFLREQVFLDWMNHGDFLWLHGPSGTGKTVLISRIINHLIGIVQTKRGTATLAYYYCEFANPSTLEPASIMGSLVRQLVSILDRIPSAVIDMYHKSSGEAPQFDMLTELLEKVVEQTLKTTYIIIDGLDECPSRQILIDTMERLRRTSKNTNSVKILLSSRPEYDIKRSLSGKTCFSIMPKHITLDMETHVRAELAQMPKLCILQHSVREELVSNLVSRADGMFRWVQCQLDTLRKIRTPRALQDALNNLPIGLYKTYDRILDLIDESDHEYVLRALNWLVGTERPLSLEELAEAIAINPEKDRFDLAERLLDPEEIFDLCGSLIRTDESGTITLAHFSVKEYLLSSRFATRGSRMEKFTLQQVLSTRYVSVCLLSYIFSVGFRIQELKQDILDEQEFPLLPYAKKANPERFCDYEAVGLWIANHLSLDGEKYREWIPFISYFGFATLHEGNYYNAWFVKSKVQCSLMCFLDGNIAANGALVQKPEIVASFKRIASLFLGWQRKWDKGNEPPLITGNTLTPLCTAATNNFTHFTQYLLANGALINGILPTLSDANPLIRALYYGHEDVARILVESGANVNVCSSDIAFGTALKAAARRSPKLVEYLLQNTDIDANIVDHFGRTIHYWAIHDYMISRNLRQFTVHLQKVRDRAPDFCDTHILYTTILNYLNNMRGLRTVRFHCNRNSLSKCLFFCGPIYYDYGAIFAEQALVSGEVMEHFNHCNNCRPFIGKGSDDIRGKRFICLDCIDGDFCADCYASWKESNGKMEACKGHHFYEIPRPCWYHLKEGTVTEDGRTLPEVIDFLEKTFKKLLEDEIVVKIDQ